MDCFELAGLTTKLIEETPKKKANVVYLDRAHIDNCFKDENRQIAPISLFIHTYELEAFRRSLINNTALL
nr:DUF2913 family protein [Vibrio sp. Vb339]